MAVLYNLLGIIAVTGNRDTSVYMKYSTKHRVYDVLFSFLCSSPLYIPTDFLRFHSVISQQFSSHFLAFHIPRLSHSCQHQPCSTGSTDCSVIRVNLPHFYNLQTEFSCTYVTSPDSISCVRADTIASETDIRFLIRSCLFVVETARKLTCGLTPPGEVTRQRN